MSEPVSAAPPPVPPSDVPSGVAPEAAAPKPPEGMGRATAVITIARSVQMASILVVGMILSRRLDSSRYATFQHVPFLAQAIPMALSVPIGKAVIFFTPRSRNPDRMLRAVAATLAGAGLLVGAAIALFPDLLRAFDPKDPNLVALRVTVGAVVGFSFAQSITEYAMFARGERMKVAWYLVVLAVWNLAVVGGTAWLAPDDQRLAWVLLGLLAAHALPACITFYWLLKPTGAPVDAPGPTRSEVLLYVTPLIGAVFVNYAAAQIDKLLVPHLFPMDEFPVAKDHYYRAAMEVPVLGAVALTMFSLVAPQMAKLHGAGDTPGLLALWRKACRSVSFVTIPATGLLCAVAFEAFTFVWGARYGEGDAVPVFRWYLLRLVLATFLPQVLLECVGATGRALVFSAVALAAAIGLTAALVPLFGLPGAAAAAVLASIGTNWIVGGWLARRFLGVGWRDLLDWNHLGRLLVTTAGATLVGLFAIPDASAFVGAAEALAGETGPAWSVALLLRGLTAGAAFAAVFAVLARVLRSVSHEDLEMLRGLVRRRSRGA